MKLEEHRKAHEESGDRNSSKNINGHNSGSPITDTPAAAVPSAGEAPITVNANINTTPLPHSTDSELENTKISNQEKDYRSIVKATKLLVEVKDIADELNMLNYLLLQQQTVWEKLCQPKNNPVSGKETEHWKGPDHAIKKVLEMDRIATRIQDSVSVCIIIICQLTVSGERYPRS